MSTETLAYRGHKINIIQDENAESPNEWGDTERFIVYDHRQFEVNRKGYEPRDIFEHINESKRDFYNGYYVFTLYAYIHSGIALSLGRTGYPFSCGWDTSSTGFVLIKRESGTYTRKQAIKAAQGLVETWNQYLSGDVWGFKIEKEGNEIDSCWGFYGQKYAIEEAKGVVDSEVKAEVKSHLQRLKKWIQNKVPLTNRTGLSIQLI